MPTSYVRDELAVVGTRQIGTAGRGVDENHDFNQAYSTAQALTVPESLDFSKKQKVSCQFKTPLNLIKSRKGRLSYNNYWEKNR